MPHPLGARTPAVQVKPGLFFIVILGPDPRIHLTTGTLLISLWIAGSKSGNDIVITIPQKNTNVKY